MFTRDVELNAMNTIQSPYYYKVRDPARMFQKLVLLLVLFLVSYCSKTLVFKFCIFQQPYHTFQPRKTQVVHGS